MGAYACEPGQGSEPTVGWYWAHEAVRAGHEVWVITRKNNRTAIEEELARVGSSQLHFVYIDLPRPFRWAKAKFGYPGLLAYYYLWQIALAIIARRLHKRVGFDIAHHVTFVSDTFPSGLCILPIPFVWGPVGGSTHVLPASIEIDLPAYARRHERIRSFLQNVLPRFDPFVAVTRRRARLILVYTREGLAGLSARERERARVITHIGVTEAEPPHRSEPPAIAEEPRLRILAGGRLVHWKGLDLLVEGFARFLHADPVDACLTFTGSGPYEPVLRGLVDRYGVSNSVRFIGRLPHREDVFTLMEEVDLYALPTLRDGPPVALLEAMAFGLPVLCLDLGAPAELVPDNAGFKIEPRSRAFVVDEIAAACLWVAHHPVEAAEMGQAARRYTLEHYQWSRMSDIIERAYQTVRPTPA